MPKRDLYRILFPKQRKALTTFGEDLLLAMKRRGWTKQMICDRTGFDNKTINKVFAGDPSVAIGTYIKVMGVLGMEDNFAKLAAHDEVGIKLQNIKLLEEEFSGNGRVLIRPLGTEPLIRVMIEGENQEYIKEKAEGLAKLIEKKLN